MRATSATDAMVVTQGSVRAASPAHCQALRSMLHDHTSPTAPGPGFFSGHFQDWFVASLMLHIRGSLPGPADVYIDLAANDAIFSSNTYFFDRCLGMQGVCFEPNSLYSLRLSTLRTCRLEATCVTSEESVVEFTPIGQVGAISTGREEVERKMHVSSRQHRLLRCATLKAALAAPPRPISRVAWMSLDVEGHELEVLRGLNWNHTQVDILSIETAQLPTSKYDKLLDILLQNSMFPAVCIGMDTLFVHHESVRDRVQNWYREREAQGRPLMPACTELYDGNRCETAKISKRCSEVHAQSCRQRFNISSC